MITISDDRSDNGTMIVISIDRTVSMSGSWIKYVTYHSSSNFLSVVLYVSVDPSAIGILLVCTLSRWVSLVVDVFPESINVTRKKRRSRQRHSYQQSITLRLVREWETARRPRTSDALPNHMSLSVSECSLLLMAETKRNASYQQLIVMFSTS